MIEATAITDRNQWLTQIRQNPSDWQAMLIFADWLEDDGDLLAAEQWRFISVCCGARTQSFGVSMVGLVDSWPNGRFYTFHSNGSTESVSGELLQYECVFAAEHNIRCMLTYPISLEDVERYYQNAARPATADLL